MSQSRYNFSQQIFGPPRLIYSISSCSHIVLQFHLASRILHNRLDSSDILSNRARMPHLEELWLEENVVGVGPNHLQEARKSIAHVVVVAEYLSPIATPNVLPNLLRIDADAVDEPL